MACDYLDYIDKIKNPYMTSRLLVRDNICALEELLDINGQELKRLKTLKRENKLDFGSKVTPEELSELLPKICSDVNEFLGVNSGSPEFSYFKLFKLTPLALPVLMFYGLSAVHFTDAVFALALNKNLDKALHGVREGLRFGIIGACFHKMVSQPYYNGASERVNLEHVKRTKLIPIAGHEYAHHVQNTEGLLVAKSNIFSEGHARGVQKHMAEKYAQEEDNEAFLYAGLDTTVGEFKSSYIWMCKKLEQKPKKSLLKIRTGRDADEGITRLIVQRPTSHALGNALFSIYQDICGDGIYKQMVHREFQFLPMSSLVESWW